MRTSGLAAFGLLFVFVAITYGQVFEVRPFEGDNLRILAWADRTHAGDLLRVNPDVYPEWRPLAYTTVWLQYRWATINHLWAYYVVNVLLWTACGWLVYHIVSALSDSAGAGLVAAVLLITSPQLISSFVLIEERQSSLACLFGLMAWLTIARAGNDRLEPVASVGVSLLLLASALSKEYGLAFAGAIAVYAMGERRRDLAAAAVAAVVIYAGLRIGLAGGAVAPFCEEHGYFFDRRNVCFDRLDTAVVTQAIYNIVATGLGSLLPGLFFEDGVISVSPRWLMVSTLLLAIAAPGWAKGPKVVRIGVLVIAFNTILSVLLYRSRNHAASLCAVSIAVGVGLPGAWAMLRRVAPSPLVGAVAVVLLTSILSMRTVVTRNAVAYRVETSSRPDPCGPDIPDLDPAFMDRIWHKYNLQFPGCGGQ